MRSAPLSAPSRLPLNGRATSPILELVVATIQIVRPLTCIMAAISPAYGIFLSGRLSITPITSVGFAMLGMACVMGMANTVNDIIDLPADRMKKMGRPLPSGRLSVSRAWTVAGLLAIGAVSASAELGWWAAGATSALLTLSVMYSYRLKNTVIIGNVTVGFVCASTLLLGAGAGGRLTHQTWVATATIFFFMVAYEIVKTLQDREADAAVSLTTLATMHDPKVSLWAYALTAGSLSLVSLGPGAVMSSHAPLYLLAVLICLVVPVWACLLLLVSEGVSHRPIAQCLTMLRLAWFPALTSLLLLA
jgi:4-hydroxybenzoate polyprenyltransferase